MSEYRRFFSYIYAYENQKKTSNAGFAKIETRGNVTTIELHMRGVHLPAPSACLYLFVRNGESIQGFSLGNVPFTNGNVDWRFTMNQPRLSDSSFEISDASGILLLLENEICFVSQWDEAPINWLSFQVYEENQEKETNTETSTEAMAQTMAQTKKEEAEAAPPVSEEKVIQSTELPQPNGMPQIFTVIPEEPAAPAEHTSQIPEGIRVNKSQPQVQPEPFHETTWADTWKELLETQPVLQPFSNADIRCMRIELKDLRMLPPSNWHLCSNSFLLQAYFTHRHLILGENPSVKGNRWFIGVPGIRYRQEHVLAAIFGFSDFLPDKQSAQAEAPFGYWYRAMNESD